ncbi:TonB-dependent receptor plug domain-containing protein [Noviherbaspirillum sp.]|uniref:TonB-dependent receptor plug domain-containing protein n=1 Tax=Noviherbaspirillum sp. TaxID=1926288 RepID=UPI002FE34A94
MPIHDRTTRLADQLCLPKAQARRRCLSTGLLSVVFFAAVVPVRAQALDADDLADLSLEELAGIRITSVSKRPESLADAPSSIFVITATDIRRSGVTTLPEAMRLAPNLQVARVDARNYAITARGFNNPFENKLLVLIDGRTVYSPLFSGVYWDAQDVVLEDVDRIEVISGPGATLWGANAVNGVINIITKPAQQTQGALAAAGFSKNERHGAARYGGALANGGHYRVYGKYATNDDTQRANGTSVLTGWHRKQAGFRTDWESGNQRISIHGDTYDGALHQQGTRDIRIAGANLVGNMNTTLADGSNLSLQAYWDYTERNQPNAFIEHLHTFDLQLQHSVKLADIHNVVWGAGYRLALDHVNNAQSFAFLPGSLNMYWGNVFVQDEIALRDNLRLTAGLKLENNNYTGVEFLPTLRLAWKPAADNLVWSSASRSVRAPSRIDRDFFSPRNPAVVNGVPQYAVAGGPDFDSEVANVFELGYRAQPSSTLSFSATAFYSRYDRLRTLEPNRNGPGAVFRNLAEGTNRGIEMWGTWQAMPAWRLAAGLVAQRVDTKLKPGSLDATGTTGLATSDPSHYWSIRSSYDIAQGKELDLTLRHVGALTRPTVPAYTALDVRYGWKIRRDLELSVVAQNLLDKSHPEYGAAPGRSEYDRALFVKLLWRR